MCEQQRATEHNSTTCLSGVDIHDVRGGREHGDDGVGLASELSNGLGRGRALVHQAVHRVCAQQTEWS